MLILTENHFWRNNKTESRIENWIESRIESEKKARKWNRINMKSCVDVNCDKKSYSGPNDRIESWIESCIESEIKV